MDEKIFAQGIYFNKPRDGAPDFVKGRIDIKSDEAIGFITEHTNEKGYVNLDLKESKAGKLYLELNTFKPVPQDMKDKSEHMDYDETHDINKELGL
jgi:hypothetical protein